MNEDQFRRIQREVTDAKADADRAQGALDQLIERLKQEFDCDDLKAAKKLLLELRTKRDAAEESFQKAIKDYERKWKRDGNT